MRRRVADIADRMQCPPDYPAVAMMAVLSGIVGRRVTIRPKRHDDWTVTPNLWAMIVGRPGIMKTPALEEVLRPVRAIQDRAMEQHRAAIADHAAQELLREQHARRQGFNTLGAQEGQQGRRG